MKKIIEKIENKKTKKHFEITRYIKSIKNNIIYNNDDFQLYIIR